MEGVKDNGWDMGNIDSNDNFMDSMVRNNSVGSGGNSNRRSPIFIDEAYMKLISHNMGCKPMEN